MLEELGESKDAVEKKLGRTTMLEELGVKKGAVEEKKVVEVRLRKQLEELGERKDEVDVNRQVLNQEGNLDEIKIELKRKQKKKKRDEQDVHKEKWNENN